MHPYLTVWLDHPSVGCGWRNALVLKETPRKVTLFFVPTLTSLEVDPRDLKGAKPVYPFHRTKVAARLKEAFDRHARLGRHVTKKLTREVRAARRLLKGGAA